MVEDRQRFRIRAVQIIQDHQQWSDVADFT